MEGDNLIPAIFTENKKDKKNLTTKLVEFLKKYKDDQNDFGGKIVKIIQCFTKNSMNMVEFIKYLSSK